MALQRGSYSAEAASRKRERNPTVAQHEFDTCYTPGTAASREREADNTVAFPASIWPVSRPDLLLHLEEGGRRGSVFLRFCKKPIAPSGGGVLTPAPPSKFRPYGRQLAAHPHPAWQTIFRKSEKSCHADLPPRWLRHSHICVARGLFVWWLRQSDSAAFAAAANHDSDVAGRFGDGDGLWWQGCPLGAAR